MERFVSALAAAFLCASCLEAQSTAPVTDPPAAPQPAAAHAPSPTEADDLRKLIESAKNSSRKNQADCDLASEVCTSNVLSLAGDASSSVTISHIPAGTCKIVATAYSVSVLGELGTDTLDTSQELPRTVAVSIHLDKWLFTSYGSVVKVSGRRARSIFRPVGDDKQPLKREGLALLVPSSTQDVKIEAWPCAGGGRQRSALAVVKMKIEYARWEIDGGGFYAFSHTTDETLTTLQMPATPTIPAQTLVLRRQSGNRDRTDTGVSLNFYPANYPFLGFMFGISASNDHAPSYFLGAGLRLLSIGRRAVVSSMAGFAIIQTKRFSGIVEGQFYSPDSPLLAGSTNYRSSGFLSIHLGLAVGGPGASGSASGSQ
jgi:hypothetical protein